MAVVYGGYIYSNYLEPLVISDFNKNFLMKFYDDLKGSAWTRSDYWFSNFSLLLWYGLTFDENFTIIGINLPRNNLQGSIPEYVYDISSLVTLNLSSNHLRGHISSNISKLLNLNSFDVSSNYQLNGLLPDEIFRMPNLRKLEIASTNLSGTFPSDICSYSPLTYINMFNVTNLCYPLCLYIPVTLGSMDAIRCQSSIDIALCQLSANYNIHNQLQSYYSQQSQVVQSAHPIVDNKSPVTVISLVNAPFYGYRISFDIQTFLGGGGYVEICQSFACNVAFQYHDGNYPNDSYPLIVSWPTIYVSYMSSLDCIDICYGLKMNVIVNQGVIGWNCIEPPLSSQLSNLKEYLNQYQIPISKSYARGFCELSWSRITCNGATLQTLDLSLLQLVGTIASGLQLLTSITTLNLEHNSFVGTIPSFIGNLSNLEILSLGYNLLDSTIPIAFTSLPRLQSLNLAQNRLYGFIPVELVELKDSLVSLDVSNNQLSGVFDNSFAVFTSTQISIAYNSPNLCYGPSLQELVRAGTLVVGEISICFPSSQPTSHPTHPTSAPVLANDAIPLLSSNDSFVKALISSVSSLVVVGILLVLYLRCFSKEKIYNRNRLKRLEELPIHRAILERNMTTTSSEMEELFENTFSFFEILQMHFLSLNERDFDGNSAFDLALLQHDISSEILIEMIKYLLPIDEQTKEVIPPSRHDYAWIKLVQHDEFAHIVKEVLELYGDLRSELACSTDSKGRSAISIASPLCKRAIDCSLKFMAKYVLPALTNYSHMSATSLVYIATETLIVVDSSELAVTIEAEPRRVALKFMSNKEHYYRELTARKRMLNFQFAIEILEEYDAERQPSFAKELRRWGITKYKYLIVMPAAKDDLETIILRSGHIAKDFSILRSFTIDLASALYELHKLGFIHGDVKPLNVMKIDDHLKLIDFDASCQIKTDFAARKYSSGYLPPELIYKENDVYLVRSGDNVSARVAATESIDCWSLGVLLYLLYSNCDLLQISREGDIYDQSELRNLMEFKDNFKALKLSHIDNREARNLVSLLLCKDPSRRLTMSGVLQHPFVTGDRPTRLVSERAKYDVFISYRVEADFEHAQQLYQLFRQSNINVWWDNVSLQPGESWEDSFCKGLATSRIFIPIISRNAINHPTIPRYNFSLLTSKSPCDNVLLEYMLALELKMRGLIEKVYPVFIGDKYNTSNSYVYGNFFNDGCLPLASNCQVESVVGKFIDQLNRLGLGSSIAEILSVSQVLSQIVTIQGALVQGDKSEVFLSSSSILRDVTKMLS